jgi:hypothetical protein
MPLEVNSAKEFNGKKAPNDQWPRLAGACLRARNDLREAAIQLSAALNSGRVPDELTRRVLTTLQTHAGGLQQALKHPRPAPPRRSHADLPPWMEVE